MRIQNIGPELHLRLCRWQAEYQPCVPAPRCPHIAAAATLSLPSFTSRAAAPGHAAWVPHGQFSCAVQSNTTRQSTSQLRSPLMSVQMCTSLSHNLNNVQQQHHSRPCRLGCAWSRWSSWCVRRCRSSRPSPAWGQRCRRCRSPRRCGAAASGRSSPRHPQPEGPQGRSGTPTGRASPVERKREQQRKSKSAEAAGRHVAVLSLAGHQLQGACEVGWWHVGRRESRSAEACQQRQQQGTEWSLLTSSCRSPAAESPPLMVRRDARHHPAVPPLFPASPSHH